MRIAENDAALRKYKADLEAVVTRATNRHKADETLHVMGLISQIVDMIQAAGIDQDPLKMRLADSLLNRLINDVGL